MAIVTVITSARVDVERTDFFHARVVVVNYRCNTELVVRWPEDRVTLVKDEAQDDVLVKRILVAIAEDAERVGLVATLQTYRCWCAARLERRIRNQRQVEEPILVDGPVGLQEVSVVRVPEVFFDQA